jgi:hypothetical protein
MSLRDNTPSDDRRMALYDVGSMYIETDEMTIDQAMFELDRVFGPIQDYERSELINHLGRCASESR